MVMLGVFQRVVPEGEDDSRVHIDLEELCRLPAGEGTEEKDGILRRLDQINSSTEYQLMLGAVNCAADPAWVLELLQRAAPSLDVLELYKASRQHLEVLQSLPRLRVLALEISATENEAWEAPALPAGHAGLDALFVSGLHYPHRLTLVALLRAHAATLREVYLVVGTPAADPARFTPWPVNYVGLARDLAPLQGLEKLVLRRKKCCHIPENCRAQLGAIKRVLPNLEVECLDCSG